MKTIVSLLGLLLALTTLGQQQRELHLVKIKTYGEKPIVQAHLNGKKAYFLVDTGSDLSVLNATDAEKYEFRKVKDYSGKQVQGVRSGKKINIDVAKEANLKLDGVHMYVKLYALDISHIAKSIKRKSNVSISGIIGIDLLTRYNFVLDFQQRALTFVTRSQNNQRTAKR